LRLSRRCISSFSFSIFSFRRLVLGRERLGRLLPIGGVELLVAIVDRLELAAVDRDARLREQA
jgi:hypothetical protein